MARRARPLACRVPAAANRAHCTLTRPSPSGPRRDLDHMPKSRSTEHSPRESQPDDPEPGPMSPEEGATTASKSTGKRGAAAAPEASTQPVPAPVAEDGAGVAKPWRDDAPDPKKTEKIAQKAAQLAEQHVEDDQDKASLEAPREVVDP